MKTAIITGVSSGMGREVLYQLASGNTEGIAEFWVIARRKERLEELQSRIPLPVRIFVLDLSDPASIETLSEILREVRPEVRLLVNAAGFGKIGPTEQIPFAEETGMIRVNCEAMCAVTRAALPYMKSGGRILQFASAAAFLPQPQFAVYAASKAFVLSYSRALNCELRSRGITVTAVCPGPVRTEFFQIAETGRRMPFYKNLFMAEPEKVVRKAIHDCMAGKSVSVYGCSMKLFRAACKVVPAELILFVLAQSGGGRRSGQKKSGQQKNSQKKDGQQKNGRRPGGYKNAVIRGKRSKGFSGKDPSRGGRKTEE